MSAPGAPSAGMPCVQWAPGIAVAAILVSPRLGTRRAPRICLGRQGTTPVGEAMHAVADTISYMVVLAFDSTFAEFELIAPFRQFSECRRRVRGAQKANTAEPISSRRQCGVRGRF